VCYEKVEKGGLCNHCNVILEDINSSTKTLKNGQKLCKTCLQNVFCYFCIEPIKGTFTQQKIGKVCLNCYRDNYCSICKDCVNIPSLELLNNNDKKNSVMKYHDMQKRNFLYCRECYKKNFCKLCDKILVMNS